MCYNRELKNGIEEWNKLMELYDETKLFFLFPVRLVYNIDFYYIVSSIDCATFSTILFTVLIVLSSLLYCVQHCLWRLLYYLVYSVDRAAFSTILFTVLIVPPSLPTILCV